MRWGSTNHCVVAPPMYPNGSLVAPKLIIGGSPMSGKATQSALISSHLDIDSVSALGLLKQAVQNNHPNASLIQDYMSRLELVPDEIIVPLVLQRVKQIESLKRGWIVDDFPRTPYQAEIATKHLKFDVFIFLDVSDQKIISRSADHFMDKGTGNIYDVANLPSDEIIRSRLIPFEDILPDITVKRLQQYYKHVNSILQQFSSKVIRVDGNESKVNVFASIISSITAFLSKCVL